MNKINKNLNIFLSFILLGLIISAIYFTYNYAYLEDEVTSIQVVANEKGFLQVKPMVFISKANEGNINLRKSYKFKKIKDSLFSVVFSDPIKLRKFRLYIPKVNQKTHIYEAAVFTQKQKTNLDFSNISIYEKLKLQNKGQGLKLETTESYGYIEFNKTFFYKSDFSKTLGLTLTILALSLLMAFVYLLLKEYVKGFFNFFSIPNVAIVTVILTIFLPAPIYNISLIISGLLLVRKKIFKEVLNNKLSLIIISFFLVYLFNNLFISVEGYKSMGTIDRFLPFLVLSLIIPLVTTKKVLIFFPLVAFTIGFYFLMTSLINVFVYDNEVFLSFNFFTKYLHPVYFSYLLFFSILYIDSTFLGKKKYILVFILFVFMIFSGSKIVSLFTLVIVGVNFLKDKKKLLLFIPLFLFLFLFSPFKSRFQEVLRLNDLSILDVEHIERHNDERINGLTFRLILWREALATMSGKDYIFGKGVTKNTEKILENRLIKLGLTHHSKYNPHNQYVDTFWRTGILGLFFLLLIPLYSLHTGIKTRNGMLIQFSLFMLVIMFTESIFGRVNGVYFFTTVLLLMMNLNTINEDSHIRN